MTVTQILVELAPYKPMTRDTLYKHLRALKIRPQGLVRQCPQQFPDNSAERILVRLGFKPAKSKTPVRQLRRAA